MRQLVQTPKFLRTFRKFAGRSPRLQKQIEDALRQIQDDVFTPTLGTHKLSGQLLGLRACSCGYDCRIVFTIQTDPKTGNEVIVLISVGTHDEVY
ncbi:MAG: type II toxin-antitoxin system mRNA interferase toxin, RelE/StbE family [Verrucomicrobiota bacterium]